MTSTWSPEPGEYQRARMKARRRPAWWLRHRQAHIIAARPSPTTAELAELGAIRHELRIRAVRPVRLRWWFGRVQRSGVRGVGVRRSLVNLC